MVEVLNIVICYYNAPEIEAYVEALGRIPKGRDVAVTVVVNGATEDDWIVLNRMVENNPKSVYVYDAEENLGYMNGLIEGYCQYRKQNSDVPRYVIMSNTDIVYEQEDFFERLLEKQYANDVWCIGPSVRNRKGGYDNPVCEQRRTKKEVDRLIFRFKLGGIYVFLSEIKSHFVKGEIGVSRHVYEIHGCFFILTSEFAEYLRAVRYPTMLYSEETFVAEHVWMNNKKTYYDNSIMVKHEEHSVTGRIKYKKISKYLKESMECIRDTFYQ